MTFTAEIVRELLDYNPITGKFVWKIRGLRWFQDADCPRCACQQWNKMNACKEAIPGENKKEQYYHKIQLLGSRVSAHRIAWLHYHGKMPDGIIDHINGNKHDNRIENLRDVSRFENNRNSKKGKNNTSGATGVYKTNSGKWSGQFWKNGQYYGLGVFETVEEASMAVKMKRKEVGGFTERHGL